MRKTVSAEHVVIARTKDEQLGYFGWPTVARLDDDTLVVAASGPRSEHICPYGKTSISFSNNKGRTWSDPVVIQDSMIDDRDAGIVCLGEKRLLVTWFRSDTRIYLSEKWLPETLRSAWKEVFATWTDDKVQPLIGSWLMISNDGGKTWGVPIRAPVSAPHGPIVLRSGNLFYLGKPYSTWNDMHNATIVAAVSSNGGRDWQIVGTVPLLLGTVGGNYHEPHAVELPDGRIIGIIRLEDCDTVRLQSLNIPHFSMIQTESSDGGMSWSVGRPLGFHGSPPHLLRHSSGVLVLTYGYRIRPFGQRLAFSTDDGVTWNHDWILRDDGPDADLGYPSTVELSDGSLFTAYYQKAALGEKCSLLGSRWRLPERLGFGSHRGGRT